MNTIHPLHPLFFSLHVELPSGTSQPPPLNVATLPSSPPQVAVRPPLLTPVAFPRVTPFGKRMDVSLARKTPLFQAKFPLLFPSPLFCSLPNLSLPFAIQNQTKREGGISEVVYLGSDWLVGIQFLPPLLLSSLLRAPPWPTPPSLSIPSLSCLAEMCPLLSSIF